MARRRKKKGTVYLVGAGPGDPGLITDRGFHLVHEADVVVYDRLVNPSLLNLAPPGARLLPARKGKYGHRRDQDRINKLLVKEARAGRHVVRLKGGDPFIYGRGGEEAEYLRKRGIPVEVVPGVTAAIGASACAGIPLTHRDLGSTVTFTTGHGAEDGSPVIPEVPKGGTLVIYMGIRTLPKVMKTLIERGWSSRTPAAVVASATLPTQKVVAGTIKTLPALTRKARIKPPALVIVGEVVRHREKSVKRQPLSGRTVVITRAHHQAWELKQPLVQLGASVIEYPAIEIQWDPNWKQVNRAFKQIEKYDALAFTSVNAVHAFISLLDDIRDLAGMKIYAVGPATAGILRAYHLPPDGVPRKATVEDLAKILPRDAKILHPCGDLANPVLRRNFDCDDVEVYRILGAKPALPVAHLESANLITFASSETVRRFSKMANGAVRKIPAVCIGPLTAKTARQKGFKVKATAKSHTVDGLVKAVRKALR